MQLYSLCTTSFFPQNVEQKRREATKTSVHVNVSVNIVAIVQQEIFLINAINKTRLIELLADTLTEKGIETYTATRDADEMIVKYVIDKASYQ